MAAAERSSKNRLIAFVITAAVVVSLLLQPGLVSLLSSDSLVMMTIIIIVATAVTSEVTTVMTITLLVASLRLGSWLTARCYKAMKSKHGRGSKAHLGSTALRCCLRASVNREAHKNRSEAKSTSVGQTPDWAETSD